TSWRSYIRRLMVTDRFSTTRRTCLAAAWATRMFTTTRIYPSSWLAAGAAATSNMKNLHPSRMSIWPCWRKRESIRRTLETVLEWLRSCCHEVLAFDLADVARQRSSCRCVNAIDRRGEEWAKDGNSRTPSAACGRECIRAGWVDCA